MLDTISLDDESLDVRATSYRSFVNANPTSTNYFQPILDRLDFTPSRFDISRSSIILEGKSDYYILRYASKLLTMSELPLLPGLEAGTLGALVALHIGWGLDFIFVLDGDQQGTVERDRYVREFGIPRSRIVTIDEFNPASKEIEQILDANALLKIRTSLSLVSNPSKSQILRFFQERLASENLDDLGPAFLQAAKNILEGARDLLSSLKK